MPLSPPCSRLVDGKKCLGKAQNIRSIDQVGILTTKERLATSAHQLQARLITFWIPFDEIASSIMGNWTTPWSVRNRDPNHFTILYYTIILTYIVNSWIAFKYIKTSKVTHWSSIHQKWSYLMLSMFTLMYASARIKKTAANTKPRQASPPAVAEIQIFWLPSFEIIDRGHRSFSQHACEPG